MTDINTELQDLLTRLVDSVKGYEEVMSQADHAALKTYISPILERRRENIATVEHFLRQRGVEVDTNGSTLGAAHRKLVDIIGGMSDDDAMIDEIVRGEKQLLQAYDDTITPAVGADPEYDFLVQQHSWLRSQIDGWQRKAA